MRPLERGIVRWETTHPAPGLSLNRAIARSFPGGFTLIELAIVLFVLSLLLGGILTPLGQQITERRNSETRQALELARTALVGYALAHRGGDDPGYLPCPDVRGDENRPRLDDGLEDRMPDGRCVSAWGLLPWRTLGLSDSDAWGNRLDYAVAIAWSASSVNQSSADKPASLQVCSDAACSTPMPAGAVLVSHGRNGLGARNSGGTFNLAPSTPDELENLDGDEHFIQRPPRAGDRPGGEFDDLLLSISADWLRGRLCDPAGICQGSGR